MEGGGEGRERAGGAGRGGGGATAGGGGAVGSGGQGRAHPHWETLPDFGRRLLEGLMVAAGRGAGVGGGTRG